MNTVLVKCGIFAQQVRIASLQINDNWKESNLVSKPNGVALSFPFLLWVSAAVGALSLWNMALLLLGMDVFLSTPLRDALAGGNILPLLRFGYAGKVSSEQFLKYLTKHKMRPYGWCFILIANDSASFFIFGKNPVLIVSDQIRKKTLRFLSVLAWNAIVQSSKNQIL